MKKNLFLNIYNLKNSSEEILGYILSPFFIISYIINKISKIIYNDLEEGKIYFSGNSDILVNLIKNILQINDIFLFCDVISRLFDFVDNQFKLYNCDNNEYESFRKIEKLYNKIKQSLGGEEEYTRHVYGLLSSLLSNINNCSEFVSFIYLLYFLCNSNYLIFNNLKIKFNNNENINEEEREFDMLLFEYLDKEYTPNVYNFEFTSGIEENIEGKVESLHLLLNKISSPEDNENYLIIVENGDEAECEFIQSTNNNIKVYRITYQYLYNNRENILSIIKICAAKFHLT